MPRDQHIIPRKPSERGAATSAVDLTRRIQSLESTPGYFGPGASVTGGWIGTSDTPPAVWIQGPAFPFGPGLFCSDSGGNIVVDIVAGQGLNLAIGSAQDNEINWIGVGSHRDSTIGTFEVGGGTQTVMELDAFSPNNAHTVTLTLGADNTAGTSGLYVHVDTSGSITLCDTSGGANWIGNVSAHSFITTSDATVKEDVQNLDPSAIQEFHKLRPVSYRHKEAQTTHLGFIAQETEVHLPQVVREFTQRQDEYKNRTLKGIDMGAMTTLLVAVVQDQAKRIEELERRVSNGTV